MLWVLKRTVSIRYMFDLMDRKVFTIIKVNHILSGHSKIDKTKVLNAVYQLSIIGLENQFWSSFEWLLKTGFTLAQIILFI